MAIKSPIQANLVENHVKSLPHDYCTKDVLEAIALANRILEDLEKASKQAESLLRPQS